MGNNSGIRFRALGSASRPSIAPSPFVNVLRSLRSSECVGAYTLERLIGRGGMGEVWLASRSDGRFEGHCAIKFVDTLTGRGRFVERFRHEGRLLARLTHPNIARLIDAGVDGE